MTILDFTGQSCRCLMEVTHRVQHEEVEAGAGAEGHQGGAAVQSVAGTHNVVARLERVFVCGLLFCNLKPARKSTQPNYRLKQVTVSPQTKMYELKQKTQVKDEPNKNQMWTKMLSGKQTSIFGTVTMLSDCVRRCATCVT